MRVILFAILVIEAMNSWGQNSITKYFCQGCCGGVGEYYLKLDSSQTFELYYLDGNAKKNNSVFGLGKFNIRNDQLTLIFESIPEARVESRKINQSDSLVVHFYVLDNVYNDSVAMVNVVTGNGKRLFYVDATGNIKTNFVGTESINFSSLGYRDIEYSFKEPGEYELRVRLNRSAKTYLKVGDIMDFKIFKEKSFEWLEYTGDKRLKFTMESCGRK